MRKKNICTLRVCCCCHCVWVCPLKIRYCGYHYTVWVCLYQRYISLHIRYFYMRIFNFIISCTCTVIGNVRAPVSRAHFSHWFWSSPRPGLTTLVSKEALNSAFHNSHFTFLLQPEQIPMAGYSHVTKPDANHHDYSDVKYTTGSRRGSSVSRKLDRQKQKEAQKWNEVWYDFTQTTTLHGVCRITEPTPFPIRKWVQLFTSGGEFSPQPEYPRGEF